MHNALTESSKTWAEYRQLVLAELIRLNDAIERIEKKNDDKVSELDDKIEKRISLLKEESVIHKVELAMLKVRSGVWGGIAGAVVMIGLLLVKMLT